ncbi:MAG: choice-of-anchor D domain-containing protein [Gemmatimonadota bacterium]|nr:MAG: choice-of-anchor D domain-containing protein [Gemmatimonadota bacterium]
MRTFFLSAVILMCILIAGSALAEDRDISEKALEAKLEAIQKAIEEKGANWTAGMTDIFRLPPEKWKRRLGALDSVSEEKLPQEKLLIRYSWQPEYFSWNDRDGQDWMTPITNQGDCGSCVAFGTMGTFEGQLNIYHDDPYLDMDLSEAHLFFCGDGLCDEGWYSNEAAQFLQESGVPDEACFPYTAGETGDDQLCEDTCPDWQDRAVKIACWGWVGGDDGVRTPAEIKEQLLQGPLTTSMQVYDDFQAYEGGIYEHVYGEEPGGHCVCIVGWDDTTDPPCWIVRNSWGTDWGERGYFRIRMGSNEVGIEGRSLFMVTGEAPVGYFSDGGYNYGNVEIGYTEDWEMNIVNEGTGSLQIYSYSSTLPDFYVSAPTTFPQTIPPGGSQDFTITFAPIALETRQGRMTFDSNNCKELPELRLRGTGIVRYVRPTPTSLEATLFQGQTTTLPLTLTNTRESTLTFTITILRDWLSADPDSGTMEAGADVTVDVTFDASSVESGEHHTNILIYTDDPEDNVVVVPITFFVEEAVITVSTPSTIRFTDPIFDLGIAVDTETKMNKALAEVSMQVGYDPEFLELLSVNPTSRCDHMSDFLWEVTEPGHVTISVSDAADNTISPGTGDVVEFSFEIQEERPCESSTMLNVSDVLLKDASGGTLDVAFEGGSLTFLCKGDVTLDGAVNVLDVLAVVNHILSLQILEGESLDRADCNADVAVDILDALGIVNVVLGIGECSPGAVMTEPSLEVIKFLETLKPYLSPRDFSDFMTMVKGGTAIPTGYNLGQNYPNPFNPTTDISYHISHGRASVPITLKIYNILGQHVRTLVDDVQEPGDYTVTWDGKDDLGTDVSSGIYVYRLAAATFSASKKMALLK